MDKDVYEHGQPPYGPPLSPDFCLGHWQTQCRATFEAPMDPDIILGGFPSGPEFRNYSADATAFVVTYPVDSSADNRCSQWPLSLLLYSSDQIDTQQLQYLFFFLLQLCTWTCCGENVQ